MGRQLFLHHYLPAHLASALVTGAVVEFVFSQDSMEHEVLHRAAKAGKSTGLRKHHLTARERFVGQSMLPSWIATIVILLVVAASWYFFLPLTYGFPGLSVDQVLRRKWLGYDLHFAK